MNDDKNKKSFEELADEALDAVAGGKSVIFHDCVACYRRSGNRQGPDGNWYCEADYAIKFPNG